MDGGSEGVCGVSCPGFSVEIGGSEGVCGVRCPGFSVAVRGSEGVCGRTAEHNCCNNF